MNKIVSILTVVRFNYKMSCSKQNLAYIHAKVYIIEWIISNGAILK